ncbi:MAG: adenosylcobinamide-GDP ribazoletransferase [Puniceicoccales bacterium]
MLSGFITALRLLSILPVPAKESRNFCDGLPWYPVAGFILGAIVACVSGAVSHLTPNWPELAALCAVICSIALTRGLHLDGVADCADGFWGGHTPARRLEIMKDSRIGAFGVIALVILLLIKFTIYTRIFATGTEWLIPAAFGASRYILTLLAFFFRYPRKSGTAAAIVQGALPRHLVLATLFTLALSFYAPIPGVATTLVAVWIAVSIGFFARSRIGGVTGDVLGAACEISELGALLLLSLLS